MFFHQRNGYCLASSFWIRELGVVHVNCVVRVLLVLSGGFHMGKKLVLKLLLPMSVPPQSARMALTEPTQSPHRAHTEPTQSPHRAHMENIGEFADTYEEDMNPMKMLSYFR